MIVKLVLFASVKELVGESELEIEVAEEATVSQVKRHLAENYPLVEELLGGCTFAVDQEYAFDGTRLYENCEVGCIPPVSGG